jgi:Domain of unknown function (DUF4266)
MKFVPLLLIVSIVAVGCANKPQVQAWEKGVLAKPEMGFGNDRLDIQLDDHTYFSKEAASGGSGVGGGGCGCN